MPDQASEQTCQHGLSQALCAGPGHYPSDGPEEALSLSEVMSATSRDYHRRGENCPWDCGNCPGNLADDLDVEPEPTHYVLVGTTRYKAFYRAQAYDLARRLARDLGVPVQVVPNR